MLTETLGQKFTVGLNHLTVKLGIQVGKILTILRLSNMQTETDN